MHSYTKKFGWPFWGGKILALGHLNKFKGDLNLTLIYNFVLGDDFFSEKMDKNQSRHNFAIKKLLAMTKISSCV